MKVGILLIAALAFFALELSATSVEPRDFSCPMCDKPFVDTVLMSYNTFGYRPARDEIFQPPQVARGSVRICPHDLYASWEDHWDEFGKGDKERLAALLKQPAVALTDEEKKIAGTDVSKLRKSPWWHLWWTRTCDQVREPDKSPGLPLFLSLYEAGNLKSPEPWIRELTAFYRGQAIKSLATSPDSHRRYLRAEWMRQSGQEQEARKVFQQLAEELARPAGKEDEEKLAEREWFHAICMEGIYLIDAAETNPGVLAEWLIASFPLPKPDGDRSAAWSRHRIALQVLVERASSGDEQAREQLWKSISRDPCRLLAVRETLKETPGAPDTEALVQCGDKWTEWLRGLAADAAAGKLPEPCRKQQDEYRDLFQSFAPPKEDEFDANWRTEVLLPRIVKAEADGKALETSLSRSELAFALGELADTAGGNGLVVRKALVRLLKQLPDPGKKAPEYGFRSALCELAKASAQPGVAPLEIDGKWKSDWWKLAAGYAVGHQEPAPQLAKHPWVSKSFGSDGKAVENLTYNLFAARKDPIWKDKLLKALDVEPWLPDEPIEYALSLENKAVNDALQRRADRLRTHKMADVPDMLPLFEIEKVEARERSAKLEALPLR